MNRPHNKRIKTDAIVSAQLIGDPRDCLTLRMQRLSSVNYFNYWIRNGLLHIPGLCHRIRKAGDLICCLVGVQILTASRTQESILSEFEFLQAWEILSSEIGNGSTLMISVVFAFLIASHIVGKQLPRIVAIIISLSYSLWVFGPLINAHASFLRLHLLSTEYYQLYPNGWLLPETSVVGFFIVGEFPFVIIWLGSLCYMHLTIRKRVPPGSGT